MVMGVALAASIYVRPIAYPLLVITPVALAAALSGSRTVRWRHAVVLLVTCAALLAPWHWRNWLVAGYSGFSLVGERALVISVAGSIEAQRNHRPFLEVRQGILDRLDITGPTLGRPAPAAIRREAWATLAHNPVVYFGIHIQGILRTVVDPSGVEYMRILGWYPTVGGFQARALDEGISTAVLTLTQRHPETVVASIALGFIALPYLFGPILASRRLQSATTGPFVLLAAVGVYLLIAGGGVPGNSRFRAPVMPLLVMMTACGWRRSNLSVDSQDPRPSLSAGGAPG
jgi:hypothetical protein